MRQPEEERREPVTHSGKRELFDDPNQPPQSCAYDPQYFERNLGMGQAQSVEVLFAHKQQCGVVDCRRRCRVVSAVKDRQLCHRATRPVHAEHVLASTGGTLEDTDVPGFDHVHARARFTFAENNLSRRIAARNSALQEESEFALGQPGKELDLRQRRTMIDFRFRHGSYCIRADSSCDISHMHPVTTLAVFDYE